MDNSGELELYLLNYRNSKLSKLDFTPTQLLLNRNLRSKLPNTFINMTPKLNRNSHEQMLINQQKQKTYYDKNATKSEIVFNEGDKVFVQNYKSKLWEKGVIIKKLEVPRSNEVKIENGRIFWRNVIRLGHRKVLSLEPLLYKNKSPRFSKIPTPITTKSGRVIKKPNRLIM